MVCASAAVTTNFVAGVLAKVCAIIAIIMVVSWAQGKDTKNKYLGGLDWNDKALVFNWHPVLMVTGLLGCFGFGITSFQNFFLPKWLNKVFHVLFYTAAIGCFSLGLKAVWMSHDDTPDGTFKPNLYTIHSWLGLATVGLFGQNFVLGLVHFVNPALALHIKQNYMPDHVFLGFVTFLTAVITMETGLTEKNGFLSCGYTVTSKDTNPIENYHNLPEGCRLSNGLGMVIFVTAILVAYSLLRGNIDNTSRQGGNDRGENHLSQQQTQQRRTDDHNHNHNPVEESLLGGIDAF